MLEKIRLNKKGAEIATTLYVWLALVLVGISALVILSLNENLQEQADDFNSLVSDFGYKERLIPSIFDKMVDDSVKEATRVKEFEKLFSEMMNETTLKADEIITKELNDARNIANTTKRLSEIGRVKSFEHFREIFLEEAGTIAKEKINLGLTEQRFNKPYNELSNLFDKLIAKDMSS